MVGALIHDIPDRNRLDPELLEQLTCERIDLGLPVLNLPTGKLPQAAVTFMVGPPAQENPVTPPDDRSDHENLSHAPR